LDSTATFCLLFHHYRLMMENKKELQPWNSWIRRTAQHHWYLGNQSKAAIVWWLAQRQKPTVLVGIQRIVV